MNPSQIPQDANGFFMWALVIVCGALATLAVGVIRWSITRLGEKERECKLEREEGQSLAKAERQEDQRNFLAAMAARDTHMSALTASVQENCKLVIETNRVVTEHHTIMLRKHEMEVGEIARLAAVAGVTEYVREQNLATH